MNPNSWKEMVLRARELDQALGHGVKRIEDNERETVIIQRRAIRALADLNAGSIVLRDNTFPLRPCPSDGIQPCDISEIEGKKLTRNIKKGDMMSKTSKLYDQIKGHLDTFEAEHAKNMAGNKAAGSRARKAIGEVKKLVTDYRKASVAGE